MACCIDHDQFPFRQMVPYILPNPLQARGLRLRRECQSWRSPNGQRTRLFSELVLIGPSPRYINDEGYEGGFTREEIEELLEFLDDHHLGWSAAMGPVIMGNPDRPELSEELVNSFCRTNPDIAKAFARVTFLSDNRSDLERCQARLRCLEPGLSPRHLLRSLKGWNI